MAPVDEQLLGRSAFESWEEWCRQGLLFTEAVEEDSCLAGRSGSASR